MEVTCARIMDPEPVPEPVCVGQLYGVGRGLLTHPSPPPPLRPQNLCVKCEVVIFSLQSFPDISLRQGFQAFWFYYIITY